MALLLSYGNFKNLNLELNWVLGSGCRISFSKNWIITSEKASTRSATRPASQYIMSRSRSISSELSNDWWSALRLRIRINQLNFARHYIAKFDTNSELTELLSQVQWLVSFVCPYNVIYIWCLFYILFTLGALPKECHKIFGIPNQTQAIRTNPLPPRKKRK